MTAILETLNVVGAWAMYRIPLISLELGIFALFVMMLLRLRVLQPARVRKRFWLVVLAKPVVMLVIISPLALNVGIFGDVHTQSRAASDSALFQRDAGVSDEFPLLDSQGPIAAMDMASGNPSFWSLVRGSLDWSHGLAIVWISGFTLLCARALMGFRRLRKLRRQAVPLDCLHDVLASLGSSLGMRRMPEVRISKEVSSPLLFGLFRPAILLPPGLYERLSPGALRLVLLHELFHWKHRDTWTLLFKRMVEALFFFHPAVWCAGRMAVRASEQACDDAVVSFTGNSAGYAACLLSISESAGSRGRCALAGLAVVDSAIGQRISRILKEGFPMISGKAVLISLIALVLVSVLGLPTLLISKSGDSVSAGSLSIFGGIELVRFAGAQVPQKAQIVFHSDRDGNSEIYVMDADGKNQRNLTNDPAEDWSPSWSPDGQSIAFLSGRDGNDEIYVMDADGRKQRNLTNDLAGDWEPSWSPDGQRIAFRSGRTRNAEIYVMDANGRNQRNLTNNPAFDSDPSWSADGQSITFNSRRDGNSEIYVMDSDGEDQHRLTNSPAFEFNPDWSPNGQSIAFARDGEIYVMDADGDNQGNLTKNPGWDWGPSWSPDGQRIAFNSDRDGNSEIYIMDADGMNLRNLTNHPALDRDPDWFDPAVAYSVTPAGKLKATWGRIKGALLSR